VKIRLLCAIALLGFGCSAADGQSEDRSGSVYELEAREPDETGNPRLARKGVVELSAPASTRKPTPDPWRIAPAVDKPTPDPWSGEGCNAPPEDSTGECAAGRDTAAPAAEPATLDP
jgi:hypothetical protein